jgi:hypothetical protein
MLAGFFSTLSERSFPGRMKRMVVDQFLVCGKIIGFNGEVLLVKRFGAGRRTEVTTIRFSLLLRGESAESIFRHSGRGIPKCQLDRTALIDPEGTVYDLKPTG